MIGQLEKNLEAIREKLKTENAIDVNIIAVSKKQPIEKIKALHKFGVKDFGENYLQEVQEKQKQLQDLEINWHFIGPIQSKKLKDIVGNFTLIHSVARTSELEKIQKLARDKNIKQKVLIQVNIANEESKNGIAPHSLDGVLREAKDLSNVDTAGLMVFPPLEDSEEKSLSWFKKGEELFKKGQSLVGESFKHLSMGTSSDYHLAVRCGATDIRVGEVLLGPRYVLS